MRKPRLCRASVSIMSMKAYSSLSWNVWLSHRLRGVHKNLLLKVGAVVVTSNLIDRSSKIRTCKCSILNYGFSKQFWRHYLITIFLTLVIRQILLSMPTSNNLRKSAKMQSQPTMVNVSPMLEDNAILRRSSSSQFSKRASMYQRVRSRKLQPSTSTQTTNRPSPTRPGRVMCGPELQSYPSKYLRSCGRTQRRMSTLMNYPTSKRLLVRRLRLLHLSY